MNIDENLIEDAITDKTKAIVVVHYAGVSCEMDTITDIAKRHNLEIKDSNFEELLASGKPVVVDFWATWCGPCKKIAPDVEALAEEYKDQVIIGKCDVDDNDELTGKFGVRNIPTVLFIKDGEVKDKTVGAVTKAQLEEKIKALL